MTPHIPVLTRPVEMSPRWVRVKFGGVTVADSRRAWLVLHYGPGRLPTYYFSANERVDLFVDGEQQPPPETAWSE